MKKPRFRPFALALSAALAASAAVRIAPLSHSPDGPLEESVRNEVERALELADAWLAAPDPRGAARRADASAGAHSVSAAEVFGLDGLDRTATALKLVSTQRVSAGTGYWTDPRPETVTNRVDDAAATRLAAGVLRNL